MKGDKKPLSINPYVLIFTVVFICGILSFIITPGTVVDGVYTALPKNEINFNNIFNIFRAIPYGLKDMSNIMILIFVVGGALEIYKRTGTIDNGINSMVKVFGKSSKTLLLIVLIVVFSALGGFLGWVEVLIPFVPLVVAVVLALGYDSMTAVAICIVGSMAGFMAGPTNLYTVAICNTTIINMGLVPADYDIFTGLGFRVVLWLIITAVSTIYIVIYANKVYKDPSKSLMVGVDVSDISLDTSAAEKSKLTWRHIVVLLTILAALIMTVIGMNTGFDGVTWSVDDVSTIFLVSALISGIVGQMKPSEIASGFIEGAKGSIGGALIVGFARGVYWIFNTANINATIVYNLTEFLRGTSPIATAIGLIIIVSLINGLIPSGSAKGSLLAPIVVPIGLELGLLPETTVLAYQFGDGITNMFWFSYGTLLIFLGYGKVPIQKWYKFFVPLMVIFFIIGFMAVGVSISMN